MTTPKNKAFFANLGLEAAIAGNTRNPYKGGWQKVAWQSGYDSAGISAKAQAAARAKAAKARMFASHPDHGGTCEAFRREHAAWKAAERYAASL